MRRALPDSFLVGGHKVTVRMSESDCKKDGEELYGYFDPDKLEVVIHPKLTGSVLRDTFLHECIEAANHLYDLSLNHQTIQTLAVAMEQVLFALIKKDDT